MAQRQFGKSDVGLSPIGLGTAAMGRDTRAWGLVDDNESIAAIHTALEMGVNWVDTSPAWGAGHAQEVVGRALQGRRDDVVILACAAAGQRDEFVRGVEWSLRRLRTDRVDVLVVQFAESSSPTAEMLAALGTLVQHGKVRAVGAAGLGPRQLAEWSSAAPLHGVSICLNMIESLREPDLAPYLAERGLATIACGALCRGLLTGHMGPMTRFGDMRARDPQFAAPRFHQNLALVERLRGIAERRGRSLAELAIGWVLAQPGVTAAAVGAKRPSQVREWAGAGREWSQADLNEVAVLLADHAGRRGPAA